MSKVSRAAGLASGATAAVGQPGGVRRLGAGCLVVALLGALVLGGGFAALSWWGDRPLAGLPCPSAGQVRVQTATTFPPAPKSTAKAVKAAVKAGGRKVKTVDPSAPDADVRLIWTEGSDLEVSTAEAPVIVRAGSKISSKQVRAALDAKEHLPTCAPKPAASLAESPDTAPGLGSGTGWRWPWEATPTLGASAAIALMAWWAAGPEVVRLAARALRPASNLLAMMVWPPRLLRRMVERAWWLWRLKRRLVAPASWPWGNLTRGERWTDPAAMADRRTPRRADREDGHRARLREARRSSRAEDREEQRAVLARLRGRLSGHGGHGKASSPIADEEGINS